MSLSLIQSAIASQTRGMSAEAWAKDEEMRAEKVALFRRYLEGDHRANLTPEMRKALRINSTGSLNEFNDNYCPVIRDTMVDRIRLERVDADNDDANAWIDALFRANRIDALQDDVHSAAVGDGDTYLIVDAVEENGRRRVRFTHEPAFDGSYGIVPFYARANDTTPLFAVRVWRESAETLADTVRVTVYYADRIERFSSVVGGTALVRYEGDGQPWQLPWRLGSEPLGVPVVPFRNRPSSYSNHGISEIENVIPLQDALNRTLYSMTMTAELTAFPIRVMIGDQAPDGLTPGMILSYFAKGPDGTASVPMQQSLDWLNAIRLDQWEQGDLVPYIEQARWLKSEMFAITNTPDGDAAATASGESLKQREIKLLGKVERFQTKNGNAWEDAVALAHRVQQAFGETPPPYEHLSARWRPAALRNDAEVIDNALKVADHIDRRTLLQLLAPAFEWDNAKIEDILSTQQAQPATSAATLDPEIEAILAGIGTGDDGDLEPAANAV